MKPFFIKCLGQRIRVIVSEELTMDGEGHTVFGMADYPNRRILLSPQASLVDLNNTFIHEFTHWFNFLALPPTPQQEPMPLDEEGRACYVGNIIGTLLRENGIDIFERLYSSFYVSKKKIEEKQSDLS